ncbi:MAG: sigma 54-interacting transcriptional regulator [Bacteroidetes bacterium]|nr:sigma 54-interacting transcriptional regulator [Bacteroidota bacterium]
MNERLKKKLPSNYAEIILDNIVDSVLVVDKNLIITYFNKSAEKLTGVKKENALGKYCYEVFRSNICENSCPMKISLNTGKDIINQYQNILTSRGKEIAVRISTSVIKDEKGNPIAGVETFTDLSPIVQLRKEINSSYTYQDIVSKNHNILKIFDTLPTIAESESTVLIQGPSGSGKELFARAIHNLSNRKKGPFIAVNCGALPDSLLESELFGYVKGAFTDAKKNKPGRFTIAKGGTLFLDEVESLSQSTQVKLLRVLQEKEFEPLGANDSIKTDVRIIAASKVDLKELILLNKFRDDLFYRLDVLKIVLPPLVERKQDIPFLISHFIEKLNNKMGKLISGVSDEVIEILMSHDFPGNIRELENIIEHSFVMCKEDVIQTRDLPLEITSNSKTTGTNNIHLKPKEIAEREIIITALKKNNYNKINTAEELGINRSTLWRKLNKYKINFVS